MPTPKPLYIAYYRVSTQRQGDSGLGLEAQREIVLRHVRQAQGRVSSEFTDVMSGRRSNRPELAKAMAEAKAKAATLIVAKLDRLSRDASFLLQLVDCGVPVFFCDLPQLSSQDPAVSRMVLTIMASFAEFESRRIGQRIRDAIAAKRARGEPIRAPMDSRKAARSWARYLDRRRTEERKHDERIQKLISRLQSRGYTLAAMADWLNRKGILTVNGRKWTFANLWRAIKKPQGQPGAGSKK